MAYKRILLRRDTASNWTSNNPTLAAGELGFETNTGKFKIGNGSTAWTSLGYSITSNISSAVLNDLGDVTITSAANGDFLRWNGTAFVNDAVNLSTDTIGSFVESLVAGTGITLSNNSGEAATPTVAVTANTFDAFGAASTAASNAGTALTNHENDTTNIHGIADTSILVTTTGTQTLTNKTITSPAGLVKGDVGLGNVDNTADTAKPVSTAQQTALDLKANLASPTFTGTPTLPTGTIATTQTAANNTTAIATTAYVDTAVANLVDSAPATLNTLDELALALGDDPSFATTVATSIGLKAPLASPTFTGTVTVPTPVNNTDAVTKTYVDSGIAGVSVTTLNDIGDVTITSAATGDFLKWSGTAFVNDQIDLGTDTVGNYVSGVTAGTGITVTHTPSEGSSPTVAVDATIATLASPTFTGTVTASNISVTSQLRVVTIIEPITVSATAATGVINIDFLTAPTVFYTASSTANWTLNVRGSSSATMNATMSTNDAATITFLATNGATAYYPTIYQIDGAAVVPKWQGGTTPSAGNASAIDGYTLTIIKTASSTYTVFASQTKFA